MAIWQFHFMIVPVQKLNEKYNTIPYSINLDSESGFFFDWKNYDINQDSLEEISQVLIPTNSWSEDIKQFGSLEESCLELIYEDGQLLEVSIRFDLRTLTKEIIITILKFIENNGAYIILDNGKVLPPSFEKMCAEIIFSDACKFVSDPRKFITQLE